MKKLLLLCLFTTPFIAAAQHLPKRISVYAQAGYKSSSYIQESSAKHIVSSTETSHHRCIVLNGGMQLELPDGWRPGFSFTYDHFGTKHRSVEFSNLNYMARLDKVWEKGRQHAFYSGAALGVRKIREFENEKEISKTVKPAYQFWVIGLEYRPVKNFYVDVNAGWGVCGILSVGGKFVF